MSFNMYKDGKTPKERNMDTSYSTNMTGQWNEYQNPNYVAFGEPDTDEKKITKSGMYGATKGLIFGGPYGVLPGMVRGLAQGKSNLEYDKSVKEYYKKYGGTNAQEEFFDVNYQDATARALGKW